MKSTLLRKLVLLSIFVFPALMLYAQDPAPSLQWVKSMNGENTANARQYKSIKDAAGNIYVGGNDDNDIIVVKYDNTGNILHTFRYNNYYNGIDYLFDLELDSDGNVLVAGYSFVDYKYSMTVAKFAPDGTLLWDYINIGDVYNTERSTRGIAIDQNNNIYFAGARNDTMYVGFLNPNGVQQWFTPVMPAGYSLGWANDVVVDGSGDAYVCGKLMNTSGNADAITFKIDNAGTVLWTKYVSGFANQDDEARMIRIDNSSNVFVTGVVADTSATNTSTFIAKYNASGGQQWLNKAHTPGQYSSEGTALYQSPIGTTYGAVSVYTTASSSYCKIYSISSTGVVNWVTSIDDPAYNNEMVTGITFDNTGNLRILGYTFNGPADAFFATLNVTFGNQTSGGIHSSPNYIFNTSNIHIDNSNNLIFPVGLYTNAKIALVKYSNSYAFQFESLHSSNGNPGDYAYRVITNGNSSVYALGNVNNAFTYTDIVVAKYSAEGDLQWQNIIDEDATFNQAYELGADTSYNIYVLGEKSYTQNFVVKLDSIGAPIWTNYLPAKYDHMVVDFQTGNAYFGGFESYVYNQAGFSVMKLNINNTVGYQYIPVSAPLYNVVAKSMAVDDLNRLFTLGEQYYDMYGAGYKKKIMLQKNGVGGSLLWTRTVSNIDSTNVSQTWVNAVKVITDGSNNAYVLCSGINGTLFNSFTTVIKYDANGNILWRRDMNHNDSNNEIPTDIIINGGNVSVLTHFLSGGISVTNLDRTDGSIADQVDLFVTTGHHTKSWKMDKDAFGNLYIAGDRFSTSTLRDMIFYKLNSTLDVQWFQVFDGDYLGEDVPADIKVTNNGRIYVAGTANNTSGQYSDYVVFKMCDISINPIQTLSNPYNICPGGTALLTAANGTTYEWNVTGEVNDSLYVNQAGEYFCTVIKGDGCAKNTDTVSVTINAIPSGQELCVVTVDTTSTYNELVWDKTMVSGADGFKIYRETAGVGFVYIAFVPYDSLSSYIDNSPGINPNIKRERYAVSILDTCGNEGPLGDFHQTIFLAPPVVNGANIYLEWFDYVGLPAGFYYRILRDTTGTGLNYQVLDSLTSSSVLNYNDLNVLSLSNTASYYIEIVLPGTCTPTRATNHNSTRSNRSATMANGIENNAFGNFSISPNPSNGIVNVELNAVIADANIRVLDVSGREVLNSAAGNADRHALDLSAFENGIYLVQISSSQGTAVKRIVLQR